MTEAPLAAALAMLGSAMLHAVMGLLTKRAADKLVFRGVMQGVSTLITLPILLLNPLPGWEVWRFLLLGAVIHYVFQMALISAYERGDMSLVYPVMRGAAPALAAVAAFVFLGEALGPVEIAGLAIASAAVAGFGWPDRGGAPKAAALAFALVAGAMTALYSVNDAAGARAAGSPFVYLAWFFVTTALPLNLTAIVRRGRRWPALVGQELRFGAVSSVFGAGSYALALYALSIAPVAEMAALRETSVIFGAILAALVLKEPFGARRTALAVTMAAGLVLLQAA